MTGICCSFLSAVWRNGKRLGIIFDALNVLEVVRKYVCRFDIKGDIIIMCNKVENEVYELRAKDKENNNEYLLNF
jgi:hypothetical protein